MEAAILRYVAPKCKSSELSHDQHNNDEKSGRTRFVNGLHGLQLYQWLIQSLQEAKQCGAKPIHGENGTVDETAVENRCCRRLAKLQEVYCDKDIFNLD